MASNLEIKAKEAFIDDHFELAVDLYTQAISLSPNNAELFADRAQANLKLRNFTEAVADANRAIELDPSMSKAYYQKGNACYELEEYQTAKAAFELGSSLAPEDARFTKFIKKCDEHIAVEKRVAAIRAIRDVQIEHLLTELHLLRSCMIEEQMGSPVLQFFTENLPHLSFDLDRGDGQFEVQWGNKDGKLFLDNTDGKTLHASLLHRMSIAHPEKCDAPPYFGGFEFPSKVKAGLLCSGKLQVSDEPLDCRMLGLPDTLRTPGLSSQRLSVGMTPKTLRLPKPGEMLLSVHGSPLGVYKEENMEVINESDED